MKRNVRINIWIALAATATATLYAYSAASLQQAQSQGIPREHVLIAYGPIVFGEYRGGEWIPVRSYLTGQPFQFREVGIATLGETRTSELVEGEEDEIEKFPGQLYFKEQDLPPDDWPIFVSGSRVRLGPGVNDLTDTPEELHTMTAYLAHSRKNIISSTYYNQILETDLDYDGKKECLISISPRKYMLQDALLEGDYEMLLCYYEAGGYGYSPILVFHTGYGVDNGPYKARIEAIADFDGDGNIEFVISDCDPWSRQALLCRFEKKKVKVLITAKFGRIE